MPKPKPEIGSERYMPALVMGQGNVRVVKIDYRYVHYESLDGSFKGRHNKQLWLERTEEKKVVK